MTQGWRPGQFERNMGGVVAINSGFALTSPTAGAA